MMHQVSEYLGAGGDMRLAALRRFAVSITLFNVAGHLLLGFEQAYAHPLVALAMAYVAELTLERLDAWARDRPPRYAGGGLRGVTDFLLPAHIAALAISMLLYPAQRFMPIAFAVTVCVATKYVIRVPIRGRLRHVLNPSNAGIAATLVMFPSVGISPPYHFTENVSGALDWVVPLAVLGSGLVLNHKLTRKTPLIIGWVGGFAAQAVVRSLLFDTPVTAALLPMTGLAFMLFTTYMITDPGTTPTSTEGQLGFGLAVAATYGLLVSLHVVFGFFFALVLVSGVRGLSLALGAVQVSLAERRLEQGRMLQPEPQP